MTPLNFSCAPELLHPDRGKKIGILQMAKKSLLPRLQAVKLEPPALNPGGLSTSTTRSTVMSKNSAGADGTASRRNRVPDSRSGQTLHVRRDSKALDDVINTGAPLQQTRSAITPRPIAEPTNQPVVSKSAIHPGSPNGGPSAAPSQPHHIPKSFSTSSLWNHKHTIPKQPAPPRQVASRDRTTSQSKMAAQNAALEAQTRPPSQSATRSRSRKSYDAKATEFGAMLPLSHVQSLPPTPPPPQSQPHQRPQLHVQVPTSFPSQPNDYTVNTNSAQSLEGPRPPIVSPNTPPRGSPSLNHDQPSPKTGGPIVPKEQIREWLSTSTSSPSLTPDPSSPANSQRYTPTTPVSTSFNSGVYTDAPGWGSMPGKPSALSSSHGGRPRVLSNESTTGNNYNSHPIYSKSPPRSAKGVLSADQRSTPISIAVRPRRPKTAQDVRRKPVPTWEGDVSV